MQRIATCIFAVAAALASRASAADLPRFESEGFHPATTSGGYLGVDGAFVLPHLGMSFGLFGNYAGDSLVLRGPDGNVLANGGTVIQNQTGLDLTASLGLIDHFEIGIGVPFVIYQQTDNRTANIPGGIASSGIGDLRLDLKILISSLRLPLDSRLGLSLIIGITAPTANSTSFLGEGGVTGRPRLVAEWRFQRLSLAMNLGAVLRDERRFGNDPSLYVTDQLSYGVGARVGLVPGLDALAELAGLIGIDLPDGASLTENETPAELRAGLGYRTRYGLEVEIAAGVGLSRGYGTTNGRAILGLRWQRPSRPFAAAAYAEPDSDGDGVVDIHDRCPHEKGPRENDGCPEQDSDGDGIADRFDVCPQVPGSRDNDGCPERDSDGDGVVDPLDRCRYDAGPAKNAGCPLPDRDGDGVPDATDRCPDKSGIAANQGCPDYDTDGDGYVDRLDKCPFDAEVFNGIDDEDGCPDSGKPLAELTEHQIVLRTPIAFLDEYKIAPQSFAVLGVVARLLRLHPELRKIRIEGHTDNLGSPLDNLDISRARAAAVRRYLIEVGNVDGSRLIAQGFGPDHPIAENRTPAGRAKNQRIELVIIDRGEVPLP